MRHPIVSDLADRFQFIRSAGIRRTGTPALVDALWRGVSNGLRNRMDTTPATLAPGAVAKVRGRKNPINSSCSQGGPTPGKRYLNL